MAAGNRPAIWEKAQRREVPHIDRKEIEDRIAELDDEITACLRRRQNRHDKGKAGVEAEKYMDMCEERARLAKRR